VLRAQACVIWLLEKDKRVMIPRAVVSLKKGRGEPARPCRVGSGIPGRVAATYKANLTPQRMVVPLVEEECLGVILVRRTDRGKPFSPLDQEILTTLAEQAVVAIRNAQMYETQERVTWGTIRSLSAILDGMDSYSPASGSGRKIMADVAMAIAREMNLPVAQQKSIQYAALLHDAGRVGIPDEILHKRSKLDSAEYDTVKQHTVKGASLLEPLEILEPALPIILYHHERYDGTGYPKGLKKEAIPLGARILAVANAFEAMVCERPYRKSVPVQEAAKEIASHAGTQFDPKVVEAFLSIARSGRLEKFFAEK
jgi:HD-GYP domain-containing protein (c-di-GMP phosphodiesterase class II)